MLNSAKKEEFAEDNFKCDKNGGKVSQESRKHCGKRRNCSLLYIHLLSLAWPIFFLRIDDCHPDRTNMAEKAASGLERVLCKALVKRTPGKHG